MQMLQERDANLQMAALVRVCDNLPTVPLALWGQDDDMRSQWRLAVVERQAPAEAAVANNRLHNCRVASH